MPGPLNWSLRRCALVFEAGAPDRDAATDRMGNVPRLAQAARSPVADRRWLPPAGPGDGSDRQGCRRIRAAVTGPAGWLAACAAPSGLRPFYSDRVIRNTDSHGRRRYPPAPQGHCAGFALLRHNFYYGVAHRRGTASPRCRVRRFVG